MRPLALQFTHRYERIRCTRCCHSMTVPAWGVIVEGERRVRIAGNAEHMMLWLELQDERHREKCGVRHPQPERVRVWSVAVVDAAKLERARFVLGG